MKQHTTYKRIAVSVIEDQAETRQGISFMINSYDGFYCTTHSSAEEALAYFKRSAPEVVLMDINLPGMDGIECTCKMKELYPEVLIMMCTVFEDSEKIFNALKAGASGYILKRESGKTLIEAIKDLVNGGAPMSSDIARKVVNSFSEKNTVENQAPVLTKRENEILDLLGKGYGNKEIADKLFVTLHTVRTHIYHIYEKLHVRNRVQALNKTGRNK